MSNGLVDRVSANVAVLYAAAIEDDQHRFERIGWAVETAFAIEDAVQAEIKKRCTPTGKFDGGPK